MANFKSLDPTYAGSGMSNVGPSTIAIWKEFLNDRSRLRNETDKIRKQYLTANAHLDDLSVIELETTVEPTTEGEKVRQHSTRYERSAKNRKAAIELHGTKCQICGFDFEEMYGALGKDFIEVRHVKPLYLSEGECAINPAEDLVCGCSNCHRMIHRRRGSIVEIDELRQVVEEKRR